MLRLPCVMFVLLALCGPCRALRVAYTVTVRPNATHIHVAMRVEEAEGPAVTLAMPVWIPGYYTPTNQHKGVSGVRALSGGAPVAGEQPTPSTWRFPVSGGAPLSVEYDVKAVEYGFRLADGEMTLGQMGVYVDKTTAFLHPGVALMYVDGHADVPAALWLDLPKGWDVATPLDKREDGSFSAPDYDTLVDSPIQAGRFGRLAFQERGRTFEIITTGKVRVSNDTLRDVCRRVAGAGIDMFGGWAPFTRYQFHLHFPPRRTWGGAGLEHRASAVMTFNNAVRDREFRDRGARLVAHEFLHAWNVKALRPEGLGPFNYQQTGSTPSLWLAEGVTDYYAHVLTVRAGLQPPERALETLEGLANQYRVSAGRNTASLVTAGQHVSTSGGSRGAGGTDYYVKGALAGWLLDILIRDATSGARGLDDALRGLVRRYAVTDTPYPPDALLAAIREVTGADVEDDYRAIVHGTEDLPLERVAALAGVAVTTAQQPDLALGTRLQPGVREPRVVGVEPGTAADKAGIAVGDLLLRVDGEPVSTSGRRLLGGKQRAVGDRVPVVVRRGTEDTLITVIVQGTPAWRFARVPSPSARANAVWEALWKPAAPPPGGAEPGKGAR